MSHIAIPGLRLGAHHGEQPSLQSRNLGVLDCHSLFFWKVDAVICDLSEASCASRAYVGLLSVAGYNHRFTSMFANDDRYRTVDLRKSGSY